MSHTPDISIRELLVFYYKYRQRLVLSFLVPFTMAIIASFIPSPRYDVSSVLIVRLGSEFVYQPEVSNTRNNGPESTIPFDRDQIFKSEVAILGSDDLHAQVIQEVGLQNLYPTIAKPGFLTWLGLKLGIVAPDEDIQNRLMAKAIIKFDKRLRVSLEKESAVITVTFGHRDAAIAVQVLDTLLKLYMEKRKQLYLEPRMDLAQSQVEATRQKAVAAQYEVEDFKRKHKIYSLSDQRAALLEERNELEQSRTTISSEALDQKIASYDKQLDRLDALEREFSNLTHEKKIAEDEYALSSHKLNEATAYEDLQRERAGSVRIIQPPTAPAEPRRMQGLIILLGFFIALFSLASMAAATEFFDSGFLTPERLERKLGLPVLAVLPLRK